MVRQCVYIRESDDFTYVVTCITYPVRYITMADAGHVMGILRNAKELVFFATLCENGLRNAGELRNADFLKYVQKHYSQDRPLHVDNGLKAYQTFVQGKISK